MRDGRDLSSAPVVYANYAWSASASSDDMEVEHIWTTIPSDRETDGNGIFLSSQYWYEANDRGYNAAGYMGSQVARTGSGVEKRQFIFSCWDADSSHQVSWTSSNCMRFGGEGVGSHCILQLPIKEGVKYRFRVAMSGSDATGAHWTGTVWDTTTGQSWNVGTLVYPHLPGMVGFGKFKVHSDDFLEYFAGGDCEGAATSGVGVLGPYFHGRTVAPSQAWPSYGSSTCGRSSVDRCIPGESCDFPRVHLAGGRGVIRDTTDGQHLWVNPPSPIPTPAPTPSPSPSPSPSGLQLWHEGRACQSQAVNLGNSFETPESCAAVARSSSQCQGYFMHSSEYWAEWGCRCCTDEQPGEYNTAWNMYSYKAAAYMV